MTVSLIFLGIIMATIIWWLLKHSLNTQPWVSDPVSDNFSGESLNTDFKAVGLTIFLAVATSLFALFVSAYSMRMGMSDWSPLSEPKLLWVNSGFLVAASISYEWTKSQLSNNEESNLKTSLLIAGVFSVLFLLGQLIAWNQLQESGHNLSGNPANSFIYVLTALHGLHLLGGLYVWGRSILKVWSGAINDVSTSIKLCAVYWHFLLIVWIVLFTLLLST